ncbi:serine protease 27-like [Schistocerca gregaria]|uniref:serine protease 27-like n=1 Tax=Schistocerca gregaria TaxID=7010 RepID=UPI00211E0090|nr:serine protease 27-like [Schistocerca gregaria]
MKMLFTHICAAIVATTTLGIAPSGCRGAGDSRRRNVTTRLIDRTSSEGFPRGMLLSNLSSCHNTRLKKFTNHPTLVREVHEQWHNSKYRIVGGKGATIEEFPFMGSLERNGFHICSMCVITMSWLLTAGLCLYDVNMNDFNTDPNYYTVAAGTALLTDGETRPCVVEQELRNVSHMVVHPNLTVTQGYPDLALVRISRPLPYKEQILPVSLPAGGVDTEYDLPTGRRCYVAGWGVTTPETTNARAAIALVTGLCMIEDLLYTLPLLQKVTMPLLSFKDCLKKCPWAKGFLVEKEHICTLSIEGKDACLGDAGGPLVCDGFMVALVSTGVGCATNTNPTFYSRTDTHMHWIVRTTDLLRANGVSPRPNTTVLLTLAMALSRICHAW